MILSVRARRGVVVVSGLSVPYANSLVAWVAQINRHRRATHRMVARSCRLWLQGRRSTFQESYRGA